MTISSVQQSNQLAYTSQTATSHLDKYVFDEAAKKRIGKTRFIFSPPHISNPASPQIANARRTFDMTVSRFVAGSATVAELERAATTVFQTTFNVNVANGRLSADDTEAIADLIYKVWDDLRNSAGRAVWAAHDKEGKALARQHGFLNNFQEGGQFINWVHFNADFYFLFEDLRAMMLNIADDFFREQVGDESNIEGRWHSTNANQLSFAGHWNKAFVRANTRWKLNAPPLQMEMFDVRISPPRGFNFFFGHFHEVGKVRTSPRFYTATGEVTLRRMLMIGGQIVTREGEFGGNRFNLLDFWGDNPTNNHFRDFLSNFHVFNDLINKLRDPTLEFSNPLGLI